MGRRVSNRSESEGGFTLVEMLIATVVVIFGLVAVAQLVPTSVMLNSNNRNDGTALVFAQRQMDVLRAQPLGVLSFTDPQGISCPSGQTCLLGDPTRPLVWAGCPTTPSFDGSDVINFAATPQTGYSFTYTDPNDPSGDGYDVRWSVQTNVNSSQAVIYRRILLGVFRRGMQTPTLPVTLDVLMEK